jgi:hypothetical protein
MGLPVAGKNSRGRIGVKLTRNIGLLVLAIYLIILGIIQLFGVHFAASGTVEGILALAAGILILIGR